MSETSTANYYRTIINGIRDPLLILNTDLTCHFMNKAAAALFDINSTTYQSRSCHDLIRNFDQPCEEIGETCPAQEALASGGLVRTIKEISLWSGIRRLYEITTFPIKDEEGRIFQVVEILRDITASHDHMELKELTAKIEQAKREWVATLDCIRDFVILVDGQNRIKRFNRPLATFLHLPFAEILGQDLARLLSGHGLEAEICILDREEYEYLHRPSGRSFAMQIFKVPASQDNEQVITLQDISHRKKNAQLLEEKNMEIHKAFTELQATQAHLLQQEKMASVGQLAAGVAHEINNPIGFVTSNINSLAKYQGKIGEFLALQDKFIASFCPSPEKTKELAEQRRKMKIDFILADSAALISESLDGVDRVKKIVMNLKNFSRVDQAERSTVNINDCLEDTIVIAWNELKYKCTLHKEYGDIPLLTCYPQQLNQVFMNMLVNAAQAMAEPGTITIKTWFADDSVFIAISDTGCGIAPANLPHVFEPFYTTKEIGKGTGLGLSISYDIIVKQHHGEISVSSEEGKGTTFTICLPLPDREETP